MCNFLRNVVFFLFYYSPSTWWRYAINATLHTIQEKRRKLTKEFMVQRVKSMCVYHRVYSSYLQTNQLNPEDSVSIKCGYHKPPKSFIYTEWINYNIPVNLTWRVYQTEIIDIIGHQNKVGDRFKVWWIEDSARTSLLSCETAGKIIQGWNFFYLVHMMKCCCFKKWLGTLNRLNHGKTIV